MIFGGGLCACCLRTGDPPLHKPCRQDSCVTPAFPEEKILRRTDRLRMKQMDKNLSRKKAPGALHI
jgi:hypothetical protein